MCVQQGALQSLPERLTRGFFFYSITSTLCHLSSCLHFTSFDILSLVFKKKQNKYLYQSSRWTPQSTVSWAIFDVFPPIKVCRLQEDLAAQYLLYRDECDARKLLITNISSMTYTPEEEAGDGMEGRWHLYTVR